MRSQWSWVRELIPKDHIHLCHLDGKCPKVALWLVFGRQPGEKTVAYWHSSIRGGNKAANLRHDLNQGDGSDECALPAHIPSRNDLETSALVPRVDIIWYEVLLSDLNHGMPSSFEHHVVGENGSDIVLCCGQVGE